jgi:GcrA cell cycle regulator
MRATTYRSLTARLDALGMDYQDPIFTPQSTTHGRPSSNVDQDRPTHLGPHRPWLCTEVNELRSLRLSGKTWNQIGDSLGRSSQSVIRKARDIGLPRQGQNSLWREDGLVESLKRLWAEGLSATVIAAKLKAPSRNSVIGKLHRLGLLGDRTRQRQRNIQHSKLPRPRKSSPRLPGPIARASRKSAVIPPAVTPALPSLNHTIEQVTGCRYIAGDDRLFCGHERQEESSYCPGHHRVCHAQS